MTTIKTLLLAVPFTLASFSQALAAQPLVDASWLKSKLGDDKVAIVDVRSAISGATPETFKAAHIPGSVHSDYLKDGWRTKGADGTIGMLPSGEKLADLFGKLGLENDDHIVIVSAGKKALDMGSATRAYWTLKVAGHDNVSILDGGFAKWSGDEANPVESGAVSVEPTTFKVELDTSRLASADDVKKAIDDDTALLDHRPNNQFVGVNKHPKARVAGTIPTSLNVPENWLTANGGGSFRPASELKQLYQAAGAKPDGAAINFCNTGHWASLGWFVSHELLGNEKAKLYDGSLVQWTAKPDAPVERKIQIN